MDDDFMRISGILGVGARLDVRLGIMDGNEAKNNSVQQYLTGVVIKRLALYKNSCLYTRYCMVLILDIKI